MSLPATTQEISSHPGANTVTEPISTEVKDRDIERKLRLFGVIRAFRDGRLPANHQIDEALKYVLDNPPVDEHKLSSEGRKLIEDTREILETFRVILRKKNSDELFQEFVWHTRHAARDREGLPIPRRRGEKSEGEGHVPMTQEQEERTKEQEAVQHLRTLLSLILTNSEVRKLLSDFSIIGRDLLSRTLQEAAGAVAPPQEHLQRVDEPSRDAPFISEGGRRIGHDETPVPEVPIPGIGAVKHDPKTGATRIRGEEGREKDVGEVTGMFREQKERAKESVARPARDVSPSGDREYDRRQFESSYGQAQQGAGERAYETRERAEGQAREIAGEHRVERGKEVYGETRQHAHERGEMEAQERARGADNEQEAEVKKRAGGIMGRIRGARDALSDRVPDQHKERIERGKKVLKDEFPEERRDQFIYRGKKVILECQKHQDYKASMNWLLGYIRHYAEIGRQETHTRTQEARERFDETHPLQRSIGELRTLLERFANNHSMDPILDAFHVLADDSKRDRELRDWFKEVDTYVRSVLLEEGFVLEPRCNDRAKELRERGRHFYDDKYKTHFDNLFNSVGDWFRAMGEDPLNQRFGEDWSRLTRDLLFDSEGSMKFKPQLWRDIRQVVVPQLVDKIGYLPIPRIEYTDPGLDLVVENLTLSGKNLLPNIVSIEAHNYVKFSPYRSIEDEGRHRFTLTLSQMQADLRDVSFYFKKKQGMPKMSDSGLMDVVMGGQGMTITAVLVSAGKDKSSVFHVQDVIVKVSSLKVGIRESKHDFLYKTLKPLLTGLIKKQIQKALADAIRTGFEYVDGQLVRVKDRMAEVPEGDENKRREILQEMFRSKREQGAVERASSIRSTGTSYSASSGEKHFKVVGTKRDSMLGNVSPTSLTHRIDEKGQEAHRGAEWRSDAFSIVKGKRREHEHHHHTGTHGTHGAHATAAHATAAPRVV